MKYLYIYFLLFFYSGYSQNTNVYFGTGNLIQLNNTSQYLDKLNNSLVVNAPGDNFLLSNTFKVSPSFLSNKFSVGIDFTIYKNLRMNVDVDLMSVLYDLSKNKVYNTQKLNSYSINISPYKQIKINKRNNIKIGIGISLNKTIANNFRVGLDGFTLTSIGYIQNNTGVDTVTYTYSSKYNLFSYPLANIAVRPFLSYNYAFKNSSSLEFSLGLDYPLFKKLSFELTRTYGYFESGNPPIDNYLKDESAPFKNVLLMPSFRYYLPIWNAKRDAVKE